MATFLANGSDILNNANVNSNSIGGQDNAGQITVSGGSQIFASDAIVRFTADPVDANGEFTGATGFSQIEVFANAADFAAGIVQFTYNPQNPGQTANVQDSVDGIGDEYIRFNANVLQSADPGAPTLSNLFVAPGSDVALSGATFDHHADQDFNDDGSIDASVPEDGNGLFNVNSGISAGAAAICFLEGTFIETPDGPRTIETLRPGDLILDTDGCEQELLYVQQRAHRKDGANYAIRFSSGIMGVERDLFISADHGVFCGAGLVGSDRRTECLVRGDALTCVDGVDVLETPRMSHSFWNIMCRKHSLIRVHGLVCETMRPQRARKLPHPTAGRSWIHERIGTFDIDSDAVVPGVAMVLKAQIADDPKGVSGNQIVLLRVNGVDYQISAVALARRFNIHKERREFLAA